MIPIQKFYGRLADLIDWCGVPSHYRQVTHQFIIFAFIGVINTALDFGLYYTLTRHTLLFADHIYVATTISFLTATTFSFFANRTWTFKLEGGATVPEALKFYATTGFGLIINLGLLAILIKVFFFHDLVAKVFTTIVVILWNFTLKKFWVFSKASSKIHF